MEIILTDEFLDEYHIKELSDYNSNYYKLPFQIKVKFEDQHKTCDVLHIECDEFSNEYYYILGYLDENNDFKEEIHVKPSSSFHDGYKLNFNNINEEMIWS